MNKNKLLKTILWIVLITEQVFALSIPDYYKIDIEVMKISLDASNKRLVCLKRGCPLKEQYAIYDKMQESINAVYHHANTTASKLVGFYTKHVIDMKKFYEENSMLQEKYKTLFQDIKKTNRQIDQYTKAQK